MNRLGDHALGCIESFTPISHGPEAAADPLRFPGYADKIATVRARLGAQESVDVGTATAGDCEIVLIRFNFEFLGGSLGTVASERVIRAIDLALVERRVLVSLISSGGMRIQEGMQALSQMQAITAALVRLRQAGVPHLAVATQPTTGGAWVSLGAAADVVLAEAGAAVSFAGSRVRSQKEDPGAFSAEGQFEAGAADAIYPHEQLSRIVKKYVRFLDAALATSAPGACFAPFALPGSSPGETGWDCVTRTRRPERPRADSYLAAYFEDRVMLSGDRAGGRDPGMLCGLGLNNGSVTAFIAQTGEANSAAGFRTAARVVSLANAWEIPILTLIDTPGACNGARAEADGIGASIAALLHGVATSRVQVTSLLIGEGGSGGALALAAPGSLWAVPSSYFSIVTPEDAVAILGLPESSVSEVADSLRLDPQSLVEMGAIDGIVQS